MRRRALRKNWQLCVLIAATLAFVAPGLAATAPPAPGDLRTSPERTEFLRGTRLADKGEHVAAAAAFDEASAATGRRSPGYRALALLLAGDALAKAGRRSDAELRWRRVLAEHPRSIWMPGARERLVAAGLAVAGATPPPASGFLSVRADGPGEVLIDGEAAGVAPLVRLRLPVGSHRVVVFGDAAGVVAEQIEIVAGEEVFRFVVLTPPTPAPSERDQGRALELGCLLCSALGRAR